MTDNTYPIIWPPPNPQKLSGQWVKLMALNWDKHGTDLAAHITGPGTENLWNYMSIGPFKALPDLIAAYDLIRKDNGWVTLAITDTATQRAFGLVSYMRIRPKHGSAEVGCVLYSRALQRSTGATEVIYLMAKYIFDTLGYRRFEWKCHNDNKASKAAALRFGFQYEGLFRKDMISKGKNRDTAWFAMTDDDWPIIRKGFETWLNADNFNETGQQHRTLMECRENHV